MVNECFEDIVTRIQNRDIRAISKIITQIENEEVPIELLKKIHGHTGNAHIIGITGPPGSGKSTLTDKIVKELRKKEKTVGVIAIDPTSPFTGGAILGDRIRMQDLATDDGVYIRSMGTRGHLGGISKSSITATKVLDAAGFDYIIIETVGVGQSEIDIVKLADTTIIVMVPGLGDDIQAIKAGIMEIGDIFVVNKCDREGSERVVTEIQMMLDLNFENNALRPPVLKTIAEYGEGIEEVVTEIDKHLLNLKTLKLLSHRRTKNIEEEIKNLIINKVTKTLQEEKYKKYIALKAKDIYDKKIDPYSVTKELINDIIKEGE